MAIGPLPPVISEIQANSGQPGKTLARLPSTGSLIDLQATATAEPTTAILPETTLIEKAVAEALGHQGGLAPLYATLAELATAPDLPDAVKAAVDMVLAFRLRDGDVTPERVAEAIRSSGLFHEAVTAGKMAATLPAAIRQALGGAPNEKRLAAMRPVTQAFSTTTSASAAPAQAISPAVPPIIGARPNAGAPASAAEPHDGGQEGSPPGTVAPATRTAPLTSTAGRTVGPSFGPDALAEFASVSRAPGPAAPPTGAAAAPPAGASVLPTQAIAANETPSTTVFAAASESIPSPPAAAVSRDGSAPMPVQAPSVDGEEARPPTRGGAGPPSLTAPAVPATAGPVNGSPIPVAGSVERSIAVALAPVSDSAEAGTPTSPAPAPSSSPSAHTTPSRSFAPWTLGRPMTPATPALAPTTPAGSSPDPGHPAAPVTTGATGGETAPPRLAGDRAPFVPSTVDSLPDVPPAPAMPRAMAAMSGPAVPHAAPDAPAQSGSVLQPAASISTPQAASGPAVGQGVVRPEERAEPQARPAMASGVDIPSAIARQPALPATGTPPMAGVDLKGALDGLRRELIVWLGRNADVMASLDGTGDEGGALRVDRPVPPRKGGPVRGQPAVSLFNGDDADAVSTETLAGRALGEAERSLSRVFLHQAATSDSRDSRVAQPTPALMFEIPIAGPNGTSIAQLRVERDDHAPSEPGAPPRRVFQVDIAFDVAPLGPVAVRVGLMDGRRVAVGVWCESDDGFVRMEAERENIVLGLEQEGMTVAGVDLHRGHPPEGRDEMATVPSHRLDLQL